MNYQNINRLMKVLRDAQTYGDPVAHAALSLLDHWQSLAKKAEEERSRAEKSQKRAATTLKARDEQLKPLINQAAAVYRAHTDLVALTKNHDPGVAQADRLYRQQLDKLVDVIDSIFSKA